MTSSFAPLVELGLVTSLGVALALGGGLLLIPAVILLGERRPTATDASTASASKG
jgi:predicted RND superfamily exporter protein